MRGHHSVQQLDQVVDVACTDVDDLDQLVMTEWWARLIRSYRASLSAAGTGFSP